MTVCVHWGGGVSGFYCLYNVHEQHLELALCHSFLSKLGNVSVVSLVAIVRVTCTNHLVRSFLVNGGHDNFRLDRPWPQAYVCHVVRT